METSREDVFEYVLREEKEYQVAGVPVVDGWDFEMYKHIRLTTLYKYGQLDTGKTENKPVENIILPILNVAYRSEDIDVKDIEPYVDDKDEYYKSFLVKKFHDKWAREFEIDTFIDNAKTSWIDFGLCLVKDKGKSPEVVPLQRLAFCDQTDVLSGPICEKHQYSPDQLLEMAGKWDAEAIDEAIMMSREEKANTQITGQKARTPGNYVEVYELHGMFPEDWNPNVKNGDPDKYTRQMHVITYYQSENKRMHGIALFQGSEPKSIYDACKRDEVFGRACGYGGAEELFEDQIWHTYSNIQMKEMLDVASAMIVATTDPGLARRQKITDLDKGEMLELEDGKEVKQVVMTPINWQVFDNWQEKKKLSARTTGSANDPQLGIEPKSGTAMGLQRTVVAQGQGIHEYRRGLFATFLSRLYKNWFIQYLVDEINKGNQWMEELDLKEMQWLSEQVTKNEGERKKKKMILQGKEPNQIDIDLFKEQLKKDFMGRGNKRFITIMKNEIKDLPIDVKVNIAGKQKDLANMTEKIVSFMQAIIASPQMLQIPGMGDLLNSVIEYSGLDPVDFSDMTQPQQPQSQPQSQPQNKQLTPQVAQQVAPAQ